LAEDIVILFYSLIGRSDADDEATLKEQLIME